MPVLFSIKHQLPGRIRVSVPGLKKDKKGLLQILGYLRSVPGIARAGGNSFTGSLLIYYDGMAHEEAVAAIESVLASEPGVKRTLDDNITPNQNREIDEPENLPVHIQAINMALAGGVLAFFGLKQVLVGKSPLAGSERLFKLASATAIISGYPIFRSGLTNLLTRGKINYDLVIGAIGLSTLLARESLPGLLLILLTNLSSLVQLLVLKHSQKVIADFIGEDEPAGVRYLNKNSGASRKQSNARTPAEKYADRIVSVALGAAAIGAVTTRDPNTALAALLAASPSPAGLARPGALSASTAVALKKGIYVRRPDAFIRMKDVDSLIFKGSGLPGCRPVVEEVLPLPGHTPAEIMLLAKDAASCIISVSPRGSHFFVEGKNILIGDKEFMLQSGISTDPALLKEKRLQLKRMFPLYVALNGELAGVLGIKQHISVETRKAIDNIRARGIPGIYITAQEDDPAVSALAGELGLTVFIPSKDRGDEEFILELQRGGSVVASVNYGQTHNDKAGADVKIVFKHMSGERLLKEADIILARDNLDLISDALELSFIASEKERRHVEITSILNVLGLLLALSRYLSPVGASLYNSLTGIVISLNSLKLLYKQ